MNNISLELEPGKELIDPEPRGSLDCPTDVAATDTDDTGVSNSNSNVNNSSDNKKRSSLRSRNSSFTSENGSFLCQQSRHSSVKTSNGCQLDRRRSLSKTKIRSRPKTVHASAGDYRCDIKGKRGHFNRYTPSGKNVKGTDHSLNNASILISKVGQLSASMDMHMVPSLSLNFGSASSLFSHQSYYNPAMPLPPPPLENVDDLSPEALFLFAAADVEVLERKLSEESRMRIEAENQCEELKRTLQEMEQRMKILAGHCRQMASQQKEDCGSIFNLETRLRQQQIQYREHELLLFQKQL